MQVALMILLIMLAALVVVMFRLMYQLTMQNGRMLLRVEYLEQLLSPIAELANNYGVEEYIAALPVGTPAPGIRLPDLDGIERTLSEWRGQRVLLVFIDPQCTFSKQLLPMLSALNTDPVQGRPVPLLVSTGSREENIELFAGLDFSNTPLLQTATEVAAAFKVDGTPMSYLIGTDGVIASELAVGIQATLILAGEMASVADATATLSADSTRITSPLDLGKAVTLRDGLRPGTSAPLFRLPRLDEGELSLLEYRGSPVIVVFSDPDCAPCDALAPRLEEFHRAATGPRVVMISRGEREATQAMVRQFGLTFPIALQRHWEISREYGIFATPAAFLIDEWGVVAARVAEGVEGILDLVTSAGQQRV